jgi:hypothetical protein
MLGSNAMLEKEHAREEDLVALPVETLEAAV